ncbi:Proton myo-inositol cotransporter [Hypsibius exemplaris]|uniref:Proton myo-inositol cotransporter n=1 Tax=Hypsibius exemplaris TaxID=2072580 RepID=A0A1W0WH61_HYPEX|nr:Proton myo-inositol cotransporter [Hypsibius exemplaris]
MAGNRLVEDPDSDEEQLAVDGLVRNKNSRFVYLLTFLSAIGGFLLGYDAGVVSGAMILLKDEFALTYAWQTALVSSTIAAAGVFSLIGGLFNERFGRKPVILCASFVFTLGSLLMASANTRTALLTGRVVVGIGIGLVSVTSSVYIAELVPSRLRGRLVTANAVLIAAGQLTAGCIDGLFAYDTAAGWRYMLAMGAVPAMVQFIGFVFLPETPAWLITNGQHEAAKAALRRVRDVDTADVDEEFSVMKMTIEERSRNAATNGCKSIVKDVLRQPALRRALIVGCLLHMFQQFIGINAVMYYSATIIQSAGLREKSVIIWIAAATSAISFASALVGLSLVDKIGRRPLILISLLGVMVSLSILAIGFQITSVYSPLVTYEEDLPVSLRDNLCGSLATCDACVRSGECGFCYHPDEESIPKQGSCLPVAALDDYTHAAAGRCRNTTLAEMRGTFWTFDSCPSPLYAWVPIVGLVLYLLFFAAGMGPMPWTINSEIYPMWARNFGIAAASATNWICNLLVTTTFLFLLENMPKYGIFWMYAGAAAIGAVFVFLMVPETKGRNIDEVEGLFAVPWAESSAATLPLEKPVQYVHIRGLNRDGRGLSIDSDSD